MLVKRALDTVAGWVQSIDEANAPDEAVLLDVRRSVQADRYSCGAQAAFMVLRYYGKARSISAVARALGTDETGTSTGALLRLFRKRGLKPQISASATIADLVRGIDADAPSVVSLDDQEHWGVVYGYSMARVYLADPSMRRSIRVAVPTERFLNRWDRWAMVVRRR